MKEGENVNENLREQIRRKYGRAATSAAQGAKPCCGTPGDDEITSNLYSAAEASELPELALRASLGCGNPTALAELKQGEVVLDLGSGGGIDVLLSAKRVGPTGFAYGLDMTDEMLAIAEANRKDAGAENVKFLKGQIEQIPLPDEAVDVILSNCVINLSTDKNTALREAFRVLRPGGRLAVSDIIIDADLPEAIRQDLDAYVGCVAGALSSDEYRQKLESAGFRNVEIQRTRTYSMAGNSSSACCASPLPGGVDAYSAFIRADKPLSSASPL